MEIFIKRNYREAPYHLTDGNVLSLYYLQETNFRSSFA